MTRTLQIGCQLGYSVTIPTAAVVQVIPRMDSGVPELDRVELHDQHWQVTNDLPHTEYTDPYGNTCRRLVLPTGTTTIEYRATATVPDEVDKADPDAPETDAAALPNDVLLFTLPSRFCESDKLANVAFKLFGASVPGYQRVAAICEWTWRYLTYAGGMTIATTSAADCYLHGNGVCRDYAHLMVAICRGLNLPARYAAGFLPDMDVPPLPAPMDFHAWVEVWLDGRWWVFDPRHNARRKGRIKIGHGRDAADLPAVTTYGAPWLTQFTVRAEEIGPAQLAS